MISEAHTDHRFFLQYPPSHPDELRNHPGVTCMFEGISFSAGIYEVVSPLGKSTVTAVPLSPRLPDLEGKHIGFVWNLFANGDILADALAELLLRRFKQMEFTRLPSGKGRTWAAYPDPSLAEVVRESGVDAVIALVGG
jgi:hypothetical protein